MFWFTSAYSRSLCLYRALLFPVLLFCVDAPAAERLSQPPTKSVNHTGLAPFVLPFDDDGTGITAFNNGSRQRGERLAPLTIDSAGHFSVAGNRFRLWGVNITGDSAFPSHKDAEKVAGRLAKFGVNIVRFHHLDNNWGGAGLIDYRRGDSRHLSKENLDKLDYFIAALKSRGIYSNINLLTAREFLPADGLPALITQIDWKARQMLGAISPAVRNLEKAYAKQILQHVNPYTRLAYRADPAIAFVEINNENSLFQQFFDGNIDRWPEAFSQPLEQEWNAWLARKYKDHAALERAWQVIDKPLGNNLLKNADFVAGLQGWHLDQIDGAKAQANPLASAGLRIQIDTVGPALWNIQLSQNLPELKDGEIYTLSFAARSQSHSRITPLLMQSAEPWQVVESFPVKLDSEWQEFRFQYAHTGSAQPLRLTLGELGSVIGAIDVRGLRLQSGGTVGELAKNQTLERRSIGLNRNDESYLAQRREDWFAFLYSLELAYWQDMHSYLADELKVKNNIYGTIASLSPPSIQREFGFIDSHIYWAHPHFPAGAWDAQQWSVDMSSMVNAFPNNTLSALARQRVAGLPFVVSEYQHAMPNPYSAEGPLLVAAYAGLQDWDGVYLFSYDQGELGWQQEFIDGFFKTNLNPAAMVNFAVGGNLFRRGDVQPAQGKRWLNFSRSGELARITNAGASWSVSPADFPPEWRGYAFHEQMGLQLGMSTTESKPPVLDVNKVTAETGELSWDTTIQAQGRVTINTEKSAGVVGFVADQHFQLGALGLTLGDLQMGWASWMVTAQEGSLQDLASGASLLAVATAKIENSKMRWNDAHNSLGRNWGEAPTRVEVVPFSLSLPIAARRVSAWCLDERGQRMRSLKVVQTATGSRIDVDSKARTLWYEIVISPKI
ncbi:carbohydrate binding domain-containing protein [Teredinibacter turnerae]|uniref:carbohydrate binding domain-containing protein n=1 Tax=Teredinibacter turnerae TaxID=2426 RepID=UPI0030CE1BAA